MTTVKTWGGLRVTPEEDGDRYIENLEPRIHAVQPQADGTLDPLP